MNPTSPPAADASSPAGHPEPVAAPGRSDDGISEERLARMMWSTLAEPGDASAQRLVEDAGPVEALHRVLSGRAESRWGTRLEEADAERQHSTFTAQGGRVLIPGDPEWPPGLLALGPEAPFCLWVRGPLDLVAATRSAAAVVGARASTPYGERVAGDLGSGLALRDITVVSGAALGIDGEAHKGALSVGGPTIAVLACGADLSYPRAHDTLIRRIAATGAVVSEIPPGSLPTRWRFIERNRLIAALSRVTVVVEAGHRSGARGTASRAARLGLPVAAVPGPVTSPMSYGCHRLLREEHAVCVTNADEVAELAAPMGEHLAPAPVTPSRPGDDLEPEERRVLDALPDRTSVTLGALIRTTGLAARDTAWALARLEARDLATRTRAGWRRP